MIAQQTPSKSFATDSTLSSNGTSSKLRKTDPRAHSPENALSAQAPPYSPPAIPISHVENTPRGYFEWVQVKHRLGFMEEEIEPAGAVVQIGQAFLMLLTSPFMILHGLFKMTGLLIGSFGLILMGLANLFKALTYKPKKRARRVISAGHLQA